MALEVVELITKHPTRRQEAEIENIIPWLRKRSTLLQDQEKNVLVDILKHCNYERVSRDDIIIRQGEKGDREETEDDDDIFFIILSGNVSVYIDPRMTGEDEVIVPDVKKAKEKKKEKKKTVEKESGEEKEGENANGEKVEAGDEKDGEGNEDGDTEKQKQDVVEGSTDESEKQKKKMKDEVHLTNLDRSQFGKFIVTYGPGKAFGEVALVKRDSLRNATIIADEDCDFLVIGQELYDRSLKAEQEQQFQQISNFIEAHPFFCNMSTKMKKLLEMSLRKETFVFDTVMVRQGEPLIGLHFILKGEATITVEPHRHPKQYPQLWPFEAGMDIYAMEFEHLRESRRNAILRQYTDEAVWDIVPEELTIRRTEGYAAIEKWMKDRHVNLCSVHEGEVLGDTETLMNLSTNLYTVKCTANTDVFILDTKNFERLVGKRNTTTINIMRQSVISKLKTRMETKQGLLVPILKFLHIKLTEQTLPKEKPLPPLKNSKTLPDKDVQLRQMLEWYKDGKVELVNPIVPGTYYYKELMKEKARKRENARKKLTENNPSIAAKIRAQRKAKPVRQPRSLIAIRQTIQQMMENDLVAMKASEKDKFKQKRKRNLDSQNPSTVPSEIGSRDISRANSQKDGEPPYIPKNFEKQDESANRNLLSVNKPKIHKSQDKQTNSNKETSINPKNVKEKDLPMIYEERTQEEIVLKQGMDGRYDSNANVKWKGRLSAGDNFDSSANTKFKSRKKSKHENEIKPDMKQKRRGSDTISEVAKSNQLEHVETFITSKQSKHPLGIKIRDEDDDDDDEDPKRLFLPQLAGLAKSSGNTDQESTSNWNLPMKFVNERIQKRLSMTDELRDVPEDIDFFTSENNLSILENKIQAFHLKLGGNGKTYQNLPKLARFTDGEVEEGPKGGGKVWVKKRSCRFADNTVKVKDHSHIRHYMVPELPEFEEVRRKKHTLQVLLSGVGPK